MYNAKCLTIGIVRTQRRIGKRRATGWLTFSPQSPGSTERQRAAGPDSDDIDHIRQSSVLGPVAQMPRGMVANLPGHELLIAEGNNHDIVSENPRLVLETMVELVNRVKSQ